MSVYIFYSFGWLANAIGHGDFSSLDYIDKVLLRLPQNIFDLATAYLIFRFIRSKYSFLPALGAMTIYAFNPATIFDLAVWGQMDSIYTFFMVTSLYAATRSRYELSGGLFSLAILTKPQSVILLPVLAYLILKNGRWKRALFSSITFFAIIFLVILPFEWNNPVKFLYDRYTEGYIRFEYNSLNAYNFWALLGFWKPDTVSHMGLSYHTWGIIVFVFFTCFVMWQLHRRYDQKAAVFAVFLLMFGFFMLMTRMHERYLFPVLALLALSWSGGFAFKRMTFWLYIGLTGTFLANLAYVLSKLNAGAFIPDGHWSIYILAPINIILFVSAIVYFFRMQRRKPAVEEPR